LPNNFSISITKDIDFYTREEYFETIESSLVKAKQDFENSPENIKQSLLKSSELNIKWDGNIDMTTYSPSEKADRILKGAYYEKALSYLEAPKVFTKSDDKILLFIKSSSGFIGIGSNKTSMTKHWIGTGIIENRESKLIDRILSPRQFEEIKSVLKFENINLINMKNFKKIGIYNGTLDFTKK
jgi:hypothetical protein